MSYHSRRHTFNKVSLLHAMAITSTIVTSFACAQAPASKATPSAQAPSKQDTSTAPAPAPALKIQLAPVAITKPFTWTKEAFDAAADYSAAYSGRAMLVMRDGEVLYERYDNGWSATKPHALASGTKSFTGIMAMMAVQDELLSLDELASDTITEWKADPRKNKITLRHLLTLSSGLEPSDALLGGRGGSRTLGEGAAQRAKRLGNDNASPPNDLFLAAIAVPSKHDADAVFEYGPSHFYAFGEVLERKLEAADQPQKSVMEYLQQRIFDDLNIKAAHIGRDRVGHPKLPGGAMLIARDWATFGQFILDQGKVRTKNTSGETLFVEKLRPDLLAQCFVASPKNASYGLTWWLNLDAEASLINSGVTGIATADGDGPAADDTSKEKKDDNIPDKTREATRAKMRERTLEIRRERDVEAMGGDPDQARITIYMAAGLGKQRLYVLPEYNIVIVRFAEATNKGRQYSDAQFLGKALGKVPANEVAK